MVMQDRHDSDRRTATFVIATSDSLASTMRCADYVLNGVNDEVEIQAAIDAIEALGAGSIVVIGKTVNLAAGLVFTPSNLTAPLLFSAYGVNFNYSGNGDAITINTNCVAGAGFAEKRVVLEGFNLYGTVAALSAIKIDTAVFQMVRDIFIASFTGGKGLYLLDTGVGGLEQCTFFHITVLDTKNPVYLYSDVADMNDTRMYDMTLCNTSPNVEPAFKVAGTHGLSRCIFIGIIAKPGQNGIGYDFGSGVSEETLFINCTVEFNFGGCTGYTSTSAVPPTLIFGDRPLITPDGPGAGSVPFGGTLPGSLYSGLYNQLLQVPHFTDSDLLVLFREGQGAKTRDLSGHRNDLDLYNAPPWGRQGILGKVTLDGATQYGKTSTNFAMSGDRTIILVTAPSYPWNDFVSYYMLLWQFDANNLVSFRKENTANQMSFFAVGNGFILGNWVVPLPWKAGDTQIFIGTIDDTAKQSAFYQNGQLLDSAIDANYSMTSNIAALYMGSHNGPGAFSGGDYPFLMVLPQCLNAQEVKDVTNELAQMLGLGLHRQNIDLFMDVLGITANHVVNNENLGAGLPITFTIAAQPDIPRTLSGHFDSHAQITEYTIVITGVDAKGNIITETKTEADLWDWETSNAFAVVTSIIMTARTGTGAGDTMDIGITDVLGLSNVIYATGDVYKIKRNNANAVVAAAQVDVTYDTYDMAVIGLVAGDDFTIWFRSNLNIVS